VRRILLSLLSLLLLVPLGTREPARGQTPAGPVIEPDDGRAPLLGLIGSATSWIDVAMYEFTDRQTLAALEGAARRGVQVRVLAEPLPGGKAVNASALAALQKAGAQTRDSSPAFRLTHEKLLLVDGATAAILSLNLTAQTFRSTRDVAVFDTSPADVTEIEAVFEADWDRQAVSVSQPDLVWSPDNARPQLLSLIASASSELDLYAEELTDRQVIAALQQAAANGLRVRLLMTDRGAGDSSRAGRAALEAAGGEVRLLQAPFVHAKMILADGGLAFLGSENLSAASLDENRELGILTADPATIARLAATFEQDWQAAAP
jgi:cardiolipin synthase